MNIVMLTEINDDTKLVRFVDKKVMRLSIGEISSGKLRYSFPLQLLSYYKKCEGIAADPNEGSTMIDLGEKDGGRVTTCNDALISCWSVCDNTTDPWASLAGSSFANRENHPCAIITTVGRVKNQIRKVLEEINDNYHDQFGALIMNAIYGIISYYPARGLRLSEWNEKAYSGLAVDLPAIQNIFHKPAINKYGQRYDAEQECRFALIINARNFSDKNSNLVSAKEIAKQLVYYSHVADPGSHYIERVCRSSQSNAHEEISIPDLLKNAETADE
jgi:hypothetical protein